MAQPRSNTATAATHTPVEDVRDLGRVARNLIADGAYLTVGAGDYAVEVVRGVPHRAGNLAAQGRTFVTSAPRKARALTRSLPDTLSQRYQHRVQPYAQRGRELVQSIQDAPPTRRAIDQARTARAQVKGAVTSVRKVVAGGTEAVTAAAEQVGADS